MEVVVNDQHIAARFHERLRNAGGGIRGDVGQARRVVALGDDHDGVRHRIFLSEGGNGFGDGGPPLADRAIDTQDILAALIQDGVDCNGGLARLPVAEDQLSLTAPDGNERIDDFNSGLERHCDGRPIHDGRGRAFDRQAPACDHRSVAVEGSAERVDDATQAIRCPRPHP